jgi:hypothetical protein
MNFDINNSFELFKSNLMDKNPKKNQKLDPEMLYTNINVLDG